MSKVFAVIGAGYGDEGKGLMTDHYASQYDGDTAVVVRSNGGAQAGHTVVTPDGERHVFSHFGSGTFNKVPTFLSQFFVLNPLLFMKEHKTFVEKFGFAPHVYIDPRCVITTPYDMLINQKLEDGRGTVKHGSCGVGFGETLERKLLGSELTMDDLVTGIYSKDWLTDKLLIILEEIREDYIQKRINMDNVDDSFNTIVNSSELIADFIAATGYMIENTSTSYPKYFRDDVLIFEGAQGLLLDQDYGYFPHVTRSNTGMKNISLILDEIPGEHDITVNYVTRHYTSRHGKGPLDNILHPNIFHDKTNVHNEFQDEIRFGVFDYDLFNSITDKDFALYAPRGSKKITTMTWMDKLYNEDNKFVKNGNTFAFTRPAFIEFMEHEFDMVSYGETRKDIKKPA